MKLYRLKILPRSPWRTPWHADTLYGMLCVTLARHAGMETLQKTILEPALAGQPPFVLSDAFPGDLLPIPVSLRLRNWPANVRKKIKKARWLTPVAFRAAQAGEEIAGEDMLPDTALSSHVRPHVTPARTSDESGEGTLRWEREEVLMGVSPGSSENVLSIYVRAQEDRQALVLSLFQLLSATGYGADASIGQGQFEVVSALEPVDWLDAQSALSGIVSLSTFQPEAHDPTEGCWELLVKYGKLGPDFGINNVFKRPLVLFRAGACFAHASGRKFLGRALEAGEFLEDEVCRNLSERAIAPVHIAFGLAVPFAMENVL